MNIRRKLFWAFDLLCLLTAFVAAQWVAPFLRNQLSHSGALYGPWIESFSPREMVGTFPSLLDYLWVFFLVTPTTLLCVDILGGHLSIRQQHPARILLTSIAAPVAGIALFSTVFFVLRTTSGYSRLFVFSFAGMSCLVLCVSRFLGRAWYRFTLLQGVHVEEVAIIAEPGSATLVAKRFKEANSPLEFKLVGLFSVSPAASPLQAEGCELPALGPVEELEHVLVHEAIQRLVIVLPSAGSPWLESAIKTCDYFRVTTHVVPATVLSSRFEDLVPDMRATSFPIPSLTLMPQHFQSDWLVLKRVMDVLVSGALLIFLLPIFAIIATAIKLTTPHLTVLYPWRVVGYRGRRFTGYKFTTMVADADYRKAELESQNEMSGPVFKISKDPRVTPLGGFLRKYSLNELPQLWSVLKGDMSLVGPRPAGPNELVRYELWHKRKLTAQPGITCFWQVRGRNRISNFDDWVHLDLEYIKTRSFWVDCKILAMTAWVVLRGTGS